MRRGLLRERPKPANLAEFCSARPKTSEKQELVRTECLALFASDPFQDTFLSTVEVPANRRQLTAGTGVGGALCRA
jgi:hypothetical protein